MRPYRIALARRAQLRAEYRRYGVHPVAQPFRLMAGTPTRSLQPITISACISRALARRLADLDR